MRRSGLPPRVIAQASLDQIRTGFRESARPADLVKETIGVILAFLDVRLVGGIDIEHGAGDGGRDFPPDEFLGEVEEVVHPDRHDRVPGAPQRFDLLVEIPSPVNPGTDENEQAVRSVNRRLADRFARDGEEAPALLPRALGQELFKPHDERFRVSRDEKGDFVTSPEGKLAHGRAQDQAGILRRRDDGRAGVEHTQRPG